MDFKNILYIFAIIQDVLEKQLIIYIMTSNFIKKSNFEFNGFNFDLDSINSWGEGVNEIYAFSEELGDSVAFFEVDGEIYWCCDDALFDVIKGNEHIDEGSVLETIIRLREQQKQMIEVNGFNDFGEEMPNFITNPIHHTIVDFKDGNPRNCSVDNLFLRE